MNRLTLAAVLTLAIFPAHAEKTMYVIDQITITLRGGEGAQFPIVRTAPSGTALEVLRVNEETGYAHVRTKDGADGWVQSQYLMAEPTARIKLARVEAENAEIKSKLEALTKEKLNWEKEWSALKVENEKLVNETTKLRSSVGGASSPEEAQALAKDKMALERDSEMLRQENQILKDRTKKEWFITGGGVILLGVLVGWLLSKMRFRRSGWGDPL